MKKTLAIVLAMLVAFSMFSMVASATADIEDANVIIEFKVNDVVVKRAGYSSVTVVFDEDFPDENQAPQTYESADGNTRYTLSGWKSSVNGEVYYPSTFYKYHPEGAKYIVLSAVYAEEDLSGRQSFWQFVESIFARINILFEYFAMIFNF